MTSDSSSKAITSGSASDASDLEDMLSAHNTFLADIERKAMLRREDEGIFLAIKALFDSILQFARSQDVLYMSLLEQKAAQKAHADTVGASAAQGKWGATGAVSAARLFPRYHMRYSSGCFHAENR